MTQTIEEAAKGFAERYSPSAEWVDMEYFENCLYKFAHSEAAKQYWFEQFKSQQAVPAKSAEEILEDTLDYFNCDNIIQKDTRIWECVLTAMHEYAAQFQQPAPTDTEIEALAEGFANAPYYKDGEKLSIAPIFYLKRGFIKGFKAALVNHPKQK